MTNTYTSGWVIRSKSMPYLVGKLHTAWVDADEERCSLEDHDDWEIVMATRVEYDPPLSGPPTDLFPDGCSLVGKLVLPDD